MKQKTSPVHRYLSITALMTTALYNSTGKQ